MEAREFDWSRHVFDHVDVFADDYDETVRFYATRRPPRRDLHICFRARSRDEVDAFHVAGVEAGFNSNGRPGYRDYGPSYYAAYPLDPNGNNVEALYRDVGNVGNVGHEG